MRILFSIVLVLTLAMFPARARADGAKEIPEVGVRNLMQSPETYHGNIQVSGVVSQVVAESRLFGLIDLEEFKTCQKVTCASLILPVHWDGSMPEIGQHLNVFGEIRKDGDHFLFSASHLTLVTGN